MNCEPSLPATIEPGPCDRRFNHNLCWSAVLAGTAVAIGIHLLLTALGVGAGLAIFTPVTDAHPVANFSVGAGLIWSLCGIIAVGFGGLVAGRFSGCPHSGFVHGLLVWSLAVILLLPGLVLGTGWALGQAMKNHAEGLGLSRSAMVLDEGELARQAAQRTLDELGSFTLEAVQSITTNAAPKASTRAQREVGFAVTKLFAPGNAAAFPANRLEAINALMVYTEMTAADATTTIDGWTTSYKNLQTELGKVRMEMNKFNAAVEQNARAATAAATAAAADVAAHRLSCAALWAFFTLLAALLGACLAGRCGANCALRHASLKRSPATTD